MISINNSGVDRMHMQKEEQRVGIILNVIIVGAIVFVQNKKEKNKTVRIVKIENGQGEGPIDFKGFFK